MEMTKNEKNDDIVAKAAIGPLLSATKATRRNTEAVARNVNNTAKEPTRKSAKVVKVHSLLQMEMFLQILIKVIVMKSIVDGKIKHKY